MSLIVQKYGGTSVADISCIKRVARRVKKTWAAGHKVVVVVSARAGVTNELIERAKNFITIESERIEKSIKKLRVKDDLYNFNQLSKESILILAENNIKTLDGLAELDSEELFNILGTKVFTNEDDAGSVIMKAREHWF